MSIYPFSLNLPGISCGLCFQNMVYGLLFTYCQCSFAFICCFQWNYNEGGGGEKQRTQWENEWKAWGHTAPNAGLCCPHVETFKHFQWLIFVLSTITRTVLHIGTKCVHFGLYEIIFTSCRCSVYVHFHWHAAKLVIHRHEQITSSFKRHRNNWL